MDEFQHPDSVWTWASDRASDGKAFLWIPYFREAKKQKGKARWQLSYNGGEFDAELKRVGCVMLYGATGQLPVEFLDDLNTHRIPLLIHRRNLPNPYIFLPASGRDDKDILSAQIRVRDNEIKTCHIARVLVRERFRAAKPAPAISATALRDLNRRRSVKLIRAWEAQCARAFWDRYFDALGLDGEHRRTDGLVQAALDAGSFFMFGVLLRWVLLHRMSPSHGYLHEPSDYAALIYDLMEPYRYIVEDAVATTYLREIPEDKADPELIKTFTAKTLAILKDRLEETVYCHPTRQFTRRKNLLHGVVLALRSYLLADMPKLIVPVESVPSGGRPPKVTFRIPGERRQPRTRVPLRSNVEAQKEMPPF